MKLTVRLSILLFLQFFIWGAWFVTLGTYLMQGLRFNGWEVGAIYSTTAIAASISPFLIGVLADRRYAVERLLAVLHFSGAALMCLTALTADFWFFYTGMLLYMLSYMPTFSLASALSFHHLALPSRDFPRVRVWGTLGWVVVSLLVGYLRVEDQVIPLYISAGASFLTGVYCLTLPHTPPQPGGASFRDWLGPEVRGLFRDRSFTTLVIAMGLIGIPAAFYYSFVNPFFNEIGVPNAAGKMSMGQMSEMVFMLVLPWALSRFGLRRVIFLGLLAWGLRYVLFAYGDAGSRLWMLYGGVILHGIAFNFAALSTQIYLNNRVPANLRSTAQGFYTFLTLGLSTFIGSYIAGAVVDAFSTGSGVHHWLPIWWVPAVVGLVVAVAFYWQFRQDEHQITSSGQK